MNDHTVLVEIENGIAVVTINRPHALNALNRETCHELRKVMVACRSDKSVAVVVITGSGEKAFVAGADIKEMQSLSPSEGWEYSREGQALFDLIESFPKPVIAAIKGFCLGGGAELAMACHLRIAADTAQIGQPEVKLGLIPGFGGTQRLPRLVGRGKAVELLCSGRMIAADEALEIGLVDRVADPKDLIAACREIGRTFADNAPLAVRSCLEAVLKGQDAGHQDGQALESALFGLCFSTEDMREGTQAFIERREPQFRGK